MAVPWRGREKIDFNDLPLDEVARRIDKARYFKSDDDAPVLSKKRNLSADLKTLSECTGNAAESIGKEIVNRYIKRCPRRISFADFEAQIKKRWKGETPALSRVLNLIQWHQCARRKNAIIKRPNAPIVHRVDSLNDVAEQINKAPGLHLICTPMASGKTKNVGAPLVASYKTAVVIAHRESLMRDTANRMGIECYKSITDRELASMTPKLAICVNSIINPLYHPSIDDAELVFIDEVSQVLKTIATASTVKERKKTLAKLRELIAGAKQVVCADADMDETTARFIAECRPNDKAHLWLMEKTPGVTIRYGEDNQIWNEIFKPGRVLIATDSKTTAATIASRFPESSRVLVVSQDTTGLPAVKEFLESPGTECLKYDAVIYTPTISSGVSIETAHFERHYGLYTGTVIPSDFIQMIRRDRTARIITIGFIGNCFGSLPTDPVKIAEQWNKANEIEYRKIRTDYGEIARPVWSDGDDFICSIRAIDNQARNDAANNLLFLFEDGGYQLERTSADADVQAVSDARQKHKEIKAESILKAVDIAPDEMHRREDSHQALTPTLAAEKARYQLRKTLGKPAEFSPAGECINPESITAADIEIDDNGRFTKKIQRFETQFAPIDVIKERSRAINQGDDKRPLIVQRLLQRRLYSAVGINPDTGAGSFTADDIETARLKLLGKSDQYHIVLGLVIPAKKPDRPAAWFTNFLRGQGLSVTKSKTGPKARRTYSYAIDSSSIVFMTMVMNDRLQHEKVSLSGIYNINTTTQLRDTAPAETLKSQYPPVIEFDDGLKVSLDILIDDLSTAPDDLEACANDRALFLAYAAAFADTATAQPDKE